MAYAWCRTDRRTRGLTSVAAGAAASPVGVAGAPGSVRRGVPALSAA
eukprot:CAMPEP_0196794066 /NCGR_PEP_ID=MMETSP1104-20130614/33906_1 /TAXON_ID=33652 /ORGANISM="Cafeteria sp., Strain Caron Lab Isolate" /LENGTH=46 /DNA_ID= /DNA_START= /DNA_END= /DNA_ORIENTATION=